MICTGIAQPGECLRIVAKNNAAHAQGDGSLPGIVLAHPLGCTPLEFCCGFGMGMMNPLPLEDLHEIPHGLRIFGTFENLRPSHRTDPKLGLRIPTEPLACRTWFRVGSLI